jgi:hypothetical protein
MCGHKDLTIFEVSAIVGFYRMGNIDTVIASVIGCEVWQVQQAIRNFKFINN